VSGGVFVCEHDLYTPFPLNSSGLSTRRIVSTDTLQGTSRAKPFFLAIRLH
jgi:hypothetical protein